MDNLTKQFIVNITYDMDKLSLTIGYLKFKTTMSTSHQASLFEK